jgi:predicted lipid-binding transport protein (Tim44 family)
VRTTYFAVQKAWSNLDMTPAKRYMSESLFDNFQTQLNWMKLKDQRNILKKVKLKEAIPVSLYDSEDDTQDLVWFYIKGRMIDYTIDTKTNMKIDGSSVAEGFCEYWQFVRREGNTWVLNRVLQKDEGDQIAFTAE